MKKLNKKPNIVLITTDQMRADAIGYINSKVITPNLDMMAKEGVVFTIHFVVVQCVLHQEQESLQEDIL